MATLTLPYPSLVFVPLDKLTAEEMNQIVANYEAIAAAFPIGVDNIGAGAVGTSQLASSAVTSTKIASAAVTRAKIAWSTVTASDIGVIAPSSTTLQTRGDINSKTVWQSDYNGFMCGIARVNATSAVAAAAVNIGPATVAGIPYAAIGVTQQVAFCIPVAVGTSVTFNVTGAGSFTSLRIVQATRS